MVERDKRGRIALPLSAAQAAEAKQAHNKSTIVPILGSDAEVTVRSTGELIYRGRSREGGMNRFAKTMAGCIGKKGCEFASCIEAGGITAPRSILKACGRGPPRPSRTELAGAGAALRGMR